MRRLKISLPLLIVFLSSITFNGCKKDDNPLAPGDELIGTWVLTKLTMTTPQGKVDMTPQEAQFEMTVVIRSDRTYTSTTVDQSVTETDNGTWSVSGDKITVKHQNQTTEVMTYRISGNKLYFDQTTTDSTSGEEMLITLEFTKQ